jgi:hypothetical protein
MDLERTLGGEEAAAENREAHTLFRASDPASAPFQGKGNPVRTHCNQARESHPDQEPLRARICFR